MPKRKKPKKGYELHPDECSHDFDDDPECCLCGCTAFDYEQKLFKKISTEKRKNTLLKGILKIAVMAMAKGGEADDDMPAGQYCRYCHKAIHWPAVQAGYGGHKKDCPYDRVQKFCRRNGIIK